MFLFLLSSSPLPPLPFLLSSSPLPPLFLSPSSSLPLPFLLSSSPLPPLFLSPSSSLPLPFLLSSSPLPPLFLSPSSSLPSPPSLFPPSNLRNNQLTGPLLQPIPSTVTVYNLDLSYFSSGFSSPPNCSQGTIFFRFNCLPTPTGGYSCPTPATPSAADEAVQRPEELCGVFCGMTAGDPPCGGHGLCYVDGPNRVPTCDCESGFVNGELPGSCVPEGSDGWAYAVVGSVEMAYSILFNLSAVPLLSVSQLRNALGASCTQGNSPSQAFQYLVTLNAKSKAGLAEAGAVVRGSGGKKRGSQSPLCGMPVFALLVQVLGIPCGKGRAPGTVCCFSYLDDSLCLPLGGLMWVLSRKGHTPGSAIIPFALRGPFLLHVQPEPRGAAGGYRLTGSDPTFPHMAPPFWIIRNSWGPEWGDGGHMRMDIQGGDGVCGINTLPGFYPVVRAARDPCNVNGTSSRVFGPLFNPCGNFTCTPTSDGASNRCDCNDPRFVEVLQPDNLRTCAYRSGHNLPVASPTNLTLLPHPIPPYLPTPGPLQGLSCSTPLVVGTVVNVVQPTDLTPYSVYYTTSQLPPTLPALPALLSFSHLGARVHHWKLTSLALHSLPALTKILLPFRLFPSPGLFASFSFILLSHLAHSPPFSPPLLFSLPSSQGDTCESLATYFSLTAGCPTPTEPCAAAFQALNPGLDCSSSSGELPGSQAVCVERRAESAAALLIPVCSHFYLVQAAETCDQIRSVLR
ncbi:unnamed protein product [Closterium sp. Yama58-4]|nr:unnamed protein product [Closterium sp. Yama58-4]